MDRNTKPDKWKKLAQSENRRHSLGFGDRILPVQHEQSKLFSGSSERFLGEMYETVARASGLTSPHDDLDLEHTDLHRIEEMASPPFNLRFLQLLVNLTAPRRVLEIGAFVGVSAIYMAKVLTPGATLTTIEKFDHFAGICRNNFKRNGVADRITLLEGDAMEVLDDLVDAEPFDLALIDGDKGRYADYFRKVDKLLAPGGVIVVDDALFHGDAINTTPTTEKGAGVKKFLEEIAKRSDYQRLLLPVANGVFVARKSVG